MSKFIDLVGLSRFLSKCREVFIRKPKKTFTILNQGVWFNREYAHLYRIVVYSEDDVISVIVECGEYARPKAKFESSEGDWVDDLVLKTDGEHKICVYYHCGAADPWIIVTDITNGEQVSLNKCNIYSDSIWLNSTEITIDRTQSKLTFDTTPTANSSNPVTSGGVKSAIDTKQNTLVSGTNIKTINNESLLGSGNISITGGSGGGGEANVIEAITFNGTPATITNKTAAITATIPDAQVQSDWNATSGMGVILNKPTIPTAVTESTVSGWGFTKNTGTYSKPSGGIPATDLASAVQTSLGKADTALQSFTETDPVFSASAAAGITASDITNWNGKTSNTGTVTGVKINGTTKNPTSGVVDLGTVLTSYTETDPTVPSWAKASTKPTYTASEVGALPLAGGTMDSGAEIYLPGSSSLSETKVTRNGVNVSPNANSFSTVTSYKHGSILYSPDGTSLNTISFPAATGTIALTSDIPTVNNSTITIQKGGSNVNSFTTNASSNKSINIPNELPSYSSSNNGQILSVVNGALSWVTPAQIYSGGSAPNNANGNNGDIYIQTSTS